MENLVEQIKKLKKEKNAVILVHSYQMDEVQAIGDFVGDSLGLCIEAQKTDADVIIFCGVHFMAESAKLLNPAKKVLLPEMNAGCPMADMANAIALKELKAKHPNAVVVTYVNSTAAVKAESDICCTSSNAVKIVQSIPEDKEIIFVPDRNLGRYVGEQAKRDLILWDGFCPTHERLTVEDILEQREAHPNALVVVHPETNKGVAENADYIGSTEQIIQFCTKSKEKEFIIGTEKGVLYRLRRDNPDKIFYPASDTMVCINMKKISLKSVYNALLNDEAEIDVSQDIFQDALRPLEKMLELS